MPARVPVKDTRVTVTMCSAGSGIAVGLAANRSLPKLLGKRHNRIGRRD